MAGNVLRFSTEMNDGVSKKLTGISKAFDKLGGKGSGASLFGNVGAAAIAKGFGLIDTAIGGTLGFLTDSVNAAKEERQSIEKLDAALRANVKGWDGNRDAIEKVLSARMALGFSDEEQRDSLALLLAAGNDVTTALEIQRSAMDLARLKGIDLNTATGALIKTQDGHYRSLQALGIVLNDGASAQDALNAVQAVANGQAQAFVNGPGGADLVRQQKMNEAQEKLGNVLLPLVIKAMDFLADVAIPALTEIAKAADAVGKGFSFWADQLDRVFNAQSKVNKISGVLGGIQAGQSAPGAVHTPHMATGGIVRARPGGTPIIAGEAGEDEFVIPASKMGGGGTGVRLQGVTEREILEMVDRGMYFRLQRAAPTLGRS